MLLMGYYLDKSISPYIKLQNAKHTITLSKNGKEFKMHTTLLVHHEYNQEFILNSDPKSYGWIFLQVYICTSFNSMKIQDIIL